MTEADLRQAITAFEFLITISKEKEELLQYQRIKKRNVKNVCYCGKFGRLGLWALASQQPVDVSESSLSDYREHSENGVTITGYEREDSERWRAEPSFEEYQQRYESLRFPEDEEYLQQEAQQRGDASEGSAQRPNIPNMIPADQVSDVIETNVALREHHARMRAALQDPQFEQLADQVVEWDPRVGTTVA